MKALILDGSGDHDPTGERVLAHLKREMQLRGWEMEHVLLRQRKIGNCAGDFFCWIRNPGQCNIDDDNRRIARSVAGCDLLVYLTPVSFGGYASGLKRTVDHLTQNNLPFFKVSEGEIHHPQRYAHHPKLLAVGWMDVPEPDAEAIFHHLVRRNAINMHFPAAVSRVVHADQRDEDLAAAISCSLEKVERGETSQGTELPRLPSALIERTPLRRALLLVGSPRGRKSTSQALGGYLLEQLAARGTLVETIQLYPALGSRERTRSLLETVDAADLIVLAFPLYIDSLPGPVMRGLELIAARRGAARPAGEAGRPAFAVIVNSGLPEAEQNRTALAICARFARQAGFSWAGGLALGGGYGVVNGTPLSQLGWRGRSIRASLELTAGSLAAGSPIPDEAVGLMAKRRIPNWMILLLGPVGWILKARQYGVVHALWRRPYLRDTV
jgi:multimeric flavodoxin WrbA